MPAASPHLRDIRPAVDSVLLMTSPTVTNPLLRERGGGVSGAAMIMWRRHGARSPRARYRSATPTGIHVIRASTSFMFFDHTPWLHRFHGLVRKIAGAYPRLSDLLRFRDCPICRPSEYRMCSAFWRRGTIACAFAGKYAKPPGLARFPAPSSARASFPSATDHAALTECQCGAITCPAGTGPANSHPPVWRVLA